MLYLPESANLKEYGTEEKPYPVAHAVLVTETGRLVLDENKKLHGLSLVGGKLDKGETSIQAIIREIAEEVGIVVTENEVMYIQENPRQYFPQTAKHFIGDLYLVKIRDQEIIKKELQIQRNITNFDQGYMDAGYIEEFESLNESFFGAPKREVIDKIQLCLQKIKQTK